MPARWALLILIAVMLIAGCSSTPRAMLDSYPDRSISEVASVPFFPQKAYQCGPAALATLLVWAGQDISPDQLAPALYIDDRKGSLQVELLATTRRHGLLPYVHPGEFERLWRLLENDVPVLVLQNLGFAWYPQWHYAVVVGFDAQQNQVLLRSGEEQLRREPFEDFAHSWVLAEQWMMSVHPPKDIPPGAEETNYLKAAHTLEQVGQGAAAITAYRAASKHWPKSMLAWMALGNSYYQRGHYAEAESAYRAAVDVAPQNPAPAHNLAWALLKQSRTAEAKVHAVRAVELGTGLPAAQQARYRSAIEAFKGQN